LPVIHAPITFEALCKRSREYQMKLIAHESRDEALRRLAEAAAPRKVVIAIGPEGGFTEAELQSAREHDFHGMSLGPRRLRADTAGLVAATKLLTVLGQLS
jgi:16S rRNA (uracil1498-N3)-methyltransferase